QGARFIHGTSIGSRLVQVPKQFLVGYALPSQAAFTAGAAVLAAAALLLLFAKAEPRARRGAAIAGVFAILAAGVPLIVAPAGGALVGRLAHRRHRGRRAAGVPARRLARRRARPRPCAGDAGARREPAERADPAGSLYPRPPPVPRRRNRPGHRDRPPGSR